MASFIFDGPNKIIQLGDNTVQFSAPTIYSEWKRWIQQGDNTKYEPAFDLAVGGNPLGGNVNLGSYYFLQNGWKIRPWNNDHTLIIEGNLFPVPDDAGLFIATVDPHNVLIAMRTSSLTQQVLIEQSDPIDEVYLADAVWNKDISGISTANYAGTVLKQSGVDAAQAASQTAAAVTAAQNAETAAEAAETAAQANQTDIQAAKASADAAKTAAEAAETASTNNAAEITAAKLAAQAAETAALAAQTAAEAAESAATDNGVDIANVLAAAQAAEAAADAAKKAANLAAALSA